MLTYLLIILLLIICSGFFSGSETGLTAISRAKIHKLTLEGNKRAATVERLRANKDRLISTILLGNNAVNILASALATSMAIEYFGKDGVAYATILMTLLILIFAEILPKSYAFHNAEKMSLAIAPLLSLITLILTPFTKTIEFFTSLLNKLFRISKEEELVSASEALRGAIELSRNEEQGVRPETDMLRSILDLAETEIEAVMIHRKHIFSLNIESKRTELIDQALQSPHTRIPLWQDKPENIVAILHAKELLKLLHHHHEKLEDIELTPYLQKPWFVPETNSLQRQLSLFKEKRKHMAIVIDEYGDLSGLITLEDILEEIVGQIEDEHDIKNNQIIPIGQHSYHIQGESTIRDINRALDWNLPENEATTIAGLVIHHAENIPNEQTSYQIGDYHFTILKKRSNQITLVKAKKVDNGA